MTTPVLVAVDGGGTKTDAVALTPDGEIVGRARGAGSSPHFVGLVGSVAVVDALVREVAGAHPVAAAELYLSGLDLPVEEESYRAALAGRDWAGDALVDNDLFAVLRAGTDEPDAIAVVCGSGVNAVGVRGDGERVRFASLGELSGDWGGGYGLGAAALWHAARALDGRGPATTLVEAICGRLGAASVDELIEDLHFERRSHDELTALPPDIFAHAAAGDEVAGQIVDRQADEVVAYIRAIVGRLELSDAAVPVVLGGSILRAGHPRLEQRVRVGMAALAPRARIVRPDAPPIAGAALLALDHVGAPAAAHDRVRAALG
ncbi:N-acetylglucosamine kinase [Microbacterium sp. W1N]|uniref:N-acetylglucosamine kinase n=1 Tax=Microbacterium festucae TaxID=2977531 RepID=UPI0021C120EB|nr:BadF/BadG/BcrA/BcrD ATPase family protein [Microbacterium festucae]MCT9819276.1 N-acetylglucosamine kinase [Microbacterium festucae]